jgi:hypothetical protein
MGEVMSDDRLAEPKVKPKTYRGGVHIAEPYGTVGAIMKRRK